ncbi:MAG: glycosyltransferase [Prosthecobacter sp.]
MRKAARIAMVLFLGGGLWLAFKPGAVGNPRLSFLPYYVNEFVDHMDFWFNLLAFTALAFTAWLAFGPQHGTFEKAINRALWVLGIITVMNIMVEVVQSSIPGRRVDQADVWAGMLGCVLGIFGGCLVQRMMNRRAQDGPPARVLFVDQTGRLGGAELMLLDIAAARAADSEVVLFQDGEFRTALEERGVKTRVLPLGEEAAVVDKQAGMLHALRAMPALCGLILRLAHAARGFDVVYANTAKALIIGGPAAWLARRALVFHLHDIVSAGHFSAMNRRALIFCSNYFASAVIANSEATQEAFIASGGRAELCSVVPNGFHITDEVPATAETTRVRESFGIPAGAWTVLMAGRLTPWKGQKVLLEALKAVPQAHVVLLGDALFTAEDHAYAAALRAQAAEPSLAGRVHFAGFRTDTRTFFELADVVVHASIHPEPFGRVIVEGMLAGRAVIATKAGGAAEIIDHEQTGLHVAPDDANDLAQALLRLQKDPALALELAQNACRTARATYGLDAVQAKIEAVISKSAFPDIKATPAPAAAAA